MPPSYTVVVRYPVRRPFAPGMSFLTEGLPLGGNKTSIWRHVGWLEAGLVYIQEVGWAMTTEGSSDLSTLALRAPPHSKHRIVCASAVSLQEIKSWTLLVAVSLDPHWPGRRWANRWQRYNGSRLVSLSRVQAGISTR